MNNTLYVINKIQLFRASILFITLLSAAAVSATEKITVWNRTFDQPNMLEVLKLALEHTKTLKKNDQLVRSEELEQARVMRHLQRHGNVDVAAFAPTIEREEKTIAIRIPVARGLLGFRVCIVRAGEEHSLKSVKSLEDWNLAGLRIGQGTHWPDTLILEANQLIVEKSSQYEPLFEMLKKKRFDCFARGINEVFSELSRPENNDLALEQNLIFLYRLPTFFFVNKKKPELAKRIERGLQLALKDGSFYKLFTKHHGDTIKKIDFKKRNIIKLTNPYLSEKTKSIANDTRLWFNPLE